MTLALDKIPSPNQDKSQPETKISLGEYFEREIVSATKNEYVNGKIAATDSATPTHNKLIGNLLLALHTDLDQDAYQVFVADLRLWIPEAAIVTYPDIMIVAEPITLMEGRKDMIENPVLIAEVLSESTEAYDRGAKFAAYRTIPTFQEYLLISQDQAYVEHFSKEANQESDRWIFTTYSLGATINLTNLGAEVKISDIYHRVLEAEKSQM